MGEGFGLYRMGDDAALMPFIDLANVRLRLPRIRPEHARDRAPGKAARR
jgi:5-oxoprolinase (ATP-hydrolysing) subunit A